MKIKLANFPNVREHTEGDPVELWLNSAGRAVVRAQNERGNNFTDVDLFDLLSWAGVIPDFGKEIKKWE